jgi:pectate lyase
MTLEGTTKAWIDHCEFVDGADGNFDIRKASDLIAVTWCKFTYTTDKKHEYSNLIGSDDGDTGDRGKLRVTFQYCWWGKGVKERMPRVRFGQVHLVNNLYNSDNSNYCARAGLEADLYIDKNAFIGVKSPLTDNDGQKFNSTFAADNLLSGVGGTNTKAKIDALKGRQGEATWNPYKTANYTLTTIDAKDVQKAVTDPCGAGATLQVTAAGEVSSPCGTGTPPATPLSAPATVDAQSTANSATVTWSPVSNATGYKVRFCENGNSSVSKIWDFTGTWSIDASNADANLILDAAAGANQNKRFDYSKPLSNAQATFANGTPIPDLEGLKFTSGAGSKLRLGFATGVVYLNGGGIAVSIPCSSGDIVTVEAVHASTDITKEDRGFTVSGGTFNETLSSPNIAGGLVVPGATGTWVYNATSNAVVITSTAGINIKKITVGTAASDCDEVTVGDTQTSYTFSPLTSGKTYSYQVQALGNSTEYTDSPFSTAKTVTIATGNGINDVKASKFTISQQNDHLVVKGDETVESLEVYSLMGITIARNERQNEINLSGVPSGVYILNINRGAVKKFIWK